MSDLIHVLLPLHREEFFNEALESTLISLTYLNEPSEVIVLDTRPLTDRKINPITLENMKIISCPGLKYEEAIALGVKNSKAKYVALMNDDDICVKERFVKQLARMEVEMADISICRFSRVKANLGKFHDFNFQPRRSYSAGMLLLGPYGANATLIANREWLDKKISREFVGVWDWSFALSTYFDAKISYLDDVLYLYRIHEGQITKNLLHINQLKKDMTPIVRSILNNETGKLFDLEFLQKILFPRYSVNNKVSLLNVIQFYRCIIVFSPNVDKKWLTYQLISRYFVIKFVRVR